MVTHFDNLFQIWLTGRKRRVLRVGIKSGRTMDSSVSQSMMVFLREILVFELQPKSTVFMENRFTE